jgi:di/tricarboxylate transporter
MTIPQVVVFSVVLLILFLPVFTRLRYDLVALLGVLLLAVIGIITPEQLFDGYGHSAVVTVAAVLVVSRGLQNAGVVDVLARWIGGVGDHISVQLAALCGLVAIASAFMNNIGALAVFMPVAIRMAHKTGRTPSLYLMPLAFSAHFGGMMTLIGTPTNIIMSGIRMQYTGEPFGMFEFAPLGLGIALACVLFISLVGWRLVPRRKGSASAKNLFDIENYLTEVIIPQNTALDGLMVRDIRTVTEANIMIVRINRGDQQLSAPSAFETLYAGDILRVRGDADGISKFITDTGVQLTESKPIENDGLESKEIALVEAIIVSGSVLERHTARNINLRWRYGVNLLAVSRHGAHLKAELSSIQLIPGDVLLLQMPRNAMQETLQNIGVLPLVGRDLNLGQPRQVVLATVIFAVAMALAAFGVLPVEITMTLAACIMIIFRLVNLREAYGSIDWPIIILLGAMLPLGDAMESTGGAQLIASQILNFSDVLSPALMLVTILLATMFLSDVVKNAVAVVLMAPIAIGVAHGLGVSIDPFLIAVTIGGSCAFLTPIGHQSNVLILEPGGYHFGDYWRLGLPIEILITIVALPLLYWLWPL